MKHTPGPWEIENGLLRSNDESNPFNTDHCIGTVETSEANANLIAAAPEMLKALEEAVDLYGEPGSIWEDVNRIIKKAKGK